MDILGMAPVQGLESVSRYTTVNPFQEDAGDNNLSFDSILNSAVNLVRQTEDFSNAAEVEEIKYATGESDSLHDLLIAQQKASVSLQYTVAVKNTVVEAYRTLMNMQF